MVNVNKLKGTIISEGLTQKAVYEAIGLTKRQWGIRMKNRKLSSDEIYGICGMIGMENLPIFFEEECT